MLDTDEQVDIPPVMNMPINCSHTAAAPWIVAFHRIARRVYAILYNPFNAVSFIFKR